MIGLKKSGAITGLLFLIFMVPGCVSFQPPVMVTGQVEMLEDGRVALPQELYLRVVEELARCGSSSK